MSNELNEAEWEWVFRAMTEPDLVFLNYNDLIVDHSVLYSSGAISAPSQEDEVIKRQAFDNLSVEAKEIVRAILSGSPRFIKGLEAIPSKRNSRSKVRKAKSRTKQKKVFSMHRLEKYFMRKWCRKTVNRALKEIKVFVSEF